MSLPKNFLAALIIATAVLRPCAAALEPVTISSAAPAEKCVNPHSEAHFGWEDYMVVVAMLVVSCCIGVFFCLFDKSQVTSEDFLLGGGTMGTFPMAMSLASGYNYTHCPSTQTITYQQFAGLSQLLSFWGTQLRCTRLERNFG